MNLVKASTCGTLVSLVVLQRDHRADVLRGEWKLLLLLLVDSLIFWRRVRIFQHNIVKIYKLIVFFLKEAFHNDTIDYPVCGSDLGGLSSSMRSGHQNIVCVKLQ